MTFLESHACIFEKSFNWRPGKHRIYNPNYIRRWKYKKSCRLAPATFLVFSPRLQSAFALGSKTRKVMLSHHFLCLSGWQDLNLRPHGPQPCMLPDCTTSRLKNSSFTGSFQRWNFFQFWNCKLNSLITIIKEKAWLFPPKLRSYLAFGSGKGISATPLSTWNSPLQETYLLI